MPASIAAPAYGALHGAFVEVVPSLDARRGIAPAARRREDPLPRPLARGIGKPSRQRIRQPHLAEPEPQVLVVKRVTGGELLADRIGQRLRQHRRPVAASLGIANEQLPPREIDILHPRVNGDSAVLGDIDG